jgi:hypothetical protein
VRAAIAAASRQTATRSAAVSRTPRLAANRQSTSCRWTWHAATTSQDDQPQARAASPRSAAQAPAARPESNPQAKMARAGSASHARHRWPASRTTRGPGRTAVPPEQAPTAHGRGLSKSRSRRLGLDLESHRGTCDAPAQQGASMMPARVASSHCLANCQPSSARRGVLSLTWGSDYAARKKSRPLADCGTTRRSSV